MSELDIANQELKNDDIDLPKALQIGILDDANLKLLVNFKRETNKLDYKLIFNIDDKKSCYDFAKDICAFANVGGGYLIIGVEPESFQIKGIGKEQEKNLDPTLVSEKFSKFLSPRINLQTYVGYFQDGTEKCRLGLVYVPPFKKRPHFIDGNYTYLDEKTGKDVPFLKAGTVYVRQHSASKIIDSDSWEELLERYYLKRSGAILKQETDSDPFTIEKREEFMEKMFKELGK